MSEQQQQQKKEGGEEKPQQQQQQQKQKKEKKPKSEATAAAGGANQLSQAPEFWDPRLKMFDELYAQQQERYEKLKEPIQITLPNGNTFDGESYVTTPLDIAKKISNSLADKVIVAKLDGNTLWDLGRVLEKSCSLELLDWDEPEAKHVFWHSSAHILGYAFEKVVPGCRLVTGPPLDETGGFFYEAETERAVTESDYNALNTAMGELSKTKSKFIRLELSKDDVLKMFGYNQFKVKTLTDKVPEGSMCSVYRCGNLIDPCRGPHVHDTGRVKAAAVTKNSSSYFRGDSANETLQRVYAMSFPKADQLKEWQKIQEAAAQRDHRKIGREQDLFMFSDVAPGTAFWLPHGFRLYSALIEFQRREYRKRGFQEVLTPNLNNAKLYMTSGHWQNYSDAMFKLECENEDYGLKPMNCPNHAILFGMKSRSYRELPLRMAEFGVLHRNELSGALTGLTRVRRFQQDDAHIFCAMDQIKSEINGALDFLKDVYAVFGFNFKLNLSTRPENALGSKEIWDTAEEHLRTAMNAFCGIPDQVVDVTAPAAATSAASSSSSSDSKFVKFSYDGTLAHMKKLKKLVEVVTKKGAEAADGYSGPTQDPWELNAGDGAFYGPKIDIQVEDALKRRHQLATIQLDFNLPERFGLKFTKAIPDSKEEHERKEKEREERDQKEKEEKAKQLQKPGAKQPKEAKVKEPLHIDRRLEANQERPVMIHRAILGSVERCVAILTEHYAGKWPFWLSPRQICVVPVAPAYFDFADELRLDLHNQGFHADADLSGSTLDRKIRDAQVAQYNFIFVVGQEEKDASSVNIRTRDNKRHGTKPIAEAVQWLKKLADTYDKDF